MRKTSIALALIAAAVLLAISCASPPPLRPEPPLEPPERTIADLIPGYVRDAVMAVPGDALVGIGTASMESEGLSRTVAQTRARAEIVRRLGAVVAYMVADYPWADPRAAILFGESVAVELSGAGLRAARIVYEDFADGGFWMAVALAWDDAAGEILAAVESAARLVPSVTAAAWGGDRLARALWRNGLDPVSVAGLE